MMENKKIKIGIIGMGYFGKNYLRIVRMHPRMKLVALADHSLKQKKKKTYNISTEIEVFTEGKELLVKANIDAVIIATPAETHFSLAKQALKKGIHVFVEKPMATNSTEAMKLLIEVRKSKTIFMVGHQYIYNDYIQYLKKRIEKKYLGDIKHICAENFYFGPIRKNVGCFLETATHEIAILDFIFGPLKNSKNSVHRAYILNKKNEDFAHATMSISETITATITTSWISPQKSRRMLFWGTKGLAVFDESTKEKLLFYKISYPKKIQHSSYIFSEKKYTVYVPKIKNTEPLQNEINHFVDCIFSNKTPLTDVTHGVRVSKILDK